MKVYLDNSSTTRPYDEVTDTVTYYMKEEYGNPSSLHHMGIETEKALKKARRKVADAMSSQACETGDIFFTSGGTESDNMAFRCAALSAGRRRGKIVTSVIEHPAVLETCRRLENSGFEIKYAGADSSGVVRTDEMKEAIDDDTIMVSLMTVNNETGAVQPVEEVSEAKGGALFHTDAVQAFGKMHIPLKNADMVSLSGHKIHGPMGTGAQWIRKGLHLQPMILGGGQENAMRSGTENVPGCAGLGKAAEMAEDRIEQRTETMSRVSGYLLEGIKDQIKDIRVNSPEKRCPAILNVSFTGTRGEVILHMLEQSGIYVSTGSACSSRKDGKSYVLKAMGLADDDIGGAIRFSFSEFNTVEEMDYVLDKLKESVERFRKLGSFR